MSKVYDARIYEGDLFEAAGAAKGFFYETGELPHYRVDGYKGASQIAIYNVKVEELTDTTEPMYYIDLGSPVVEGFHNDDLDILLGFVLEDGENVYITINDSNAQSFALC